MKMKYGLALILYALSAIACGTEGNGRVLNITLRPHENVLLVEIEHPIIKGTQPECVHYFHTYGAPLDYRDAWRALYAMLVAAKVSDEPVWILGTGECVPKHGAEMIREINMGPWLNN